ncbi:carbohydrate-binding protein [Flavobacterium jejuense]|uniref:Carbohydrate-binding protein n=1 Tax=Flavobacterium jejuense TaxID=1544455 RepID=A0ABX0ILU9_9FLAO|nr:carbohydrate-binding protein [Flavobacterium jejuense]NHN24772.1 carbohydrate-binding protein [Flavobacterium jejuense]
MKTNKKLILLLVMLLCKITLTEAQNLNLKLMSFNVQQPFGGTNWEGRKTNAAYIFNITQADVIGTQEAVNFQRDYLQQQTGYAWFGTGRDGGDNGEGSWIFYKGDKYTIDTANSGNFWLSNTPNVPSAFEGSYNRICTYVHLIENSTGKGFYVFNAHFPTSNFTTARLNSMKLLAERMATRAILTDPVYATGDFNSTEGDIVTNWMKNGSDNPIKCRDTYRDVYPTGPVNTGFETKFDYIYCPKGTQYTSQNSWVIDNPKASDHYPIVAEVQYAYQNNPPSPTTHAIPGKIEAEQYANQVGIELENTSDTGGGKNIGYLDTNDWATYKVNVASTATYTFELRVAGESQNGALNVYIDDQYNQTISIPATNGWQNWQTITEDIDLPAGSHTIKIQVTTPGFNINWFNFVASNSSGLVIPGKIEAENYASTFGTELENTSDTGGGQNVGYLDTNDILEYTVTVTATANYNFAIRVASLSSNGRINVLVDNQIKKTIDLPVTGGWQTWQTYNTTISLPQGTHQLKLEVVQSGFNLNWFNFSTSSSARESLVSEKTSSSSFYPNPTTDYIHFDKEYEWSVYNLTGKKVATGRSQKADMTILSTGIYILHFNGEQKKLVIH